MLSRLLLLGYYKIRPSAGAAALLFVFIPALTCAAVGDCIRAIKDQPIAENEDKIAMRNFRFHTPTPFQPVNRTSEFNRSLETGTVDWSRIPKEGILLEHRNILVVLMPNKVVRKWRTKERIQNEISSQQEAEQKGLNVAPLLNVYIHPELDLGYVERPFIPGIDFGEYLKRGETSEAVVEQVTVMDRLRLGSTRPRNLQNAVGAHTNMMVTPTGEVVLYDPE